METIKLQTQSSLYENAEGQFRAFSFNELSTKEFIIYQNGQPKYIVDLTRQDKPLIQEFIAKLNSDENLETIIWKLGNFLGRKWTTQNNIDGKLITGSGQSEIIEMVFLDDRADFWIPLTFIATNEIDYDVLLNEEKLFATYLPEDIRDDWGLESAFIDNFENLIKMLAFLFEKEIKLLQLTANTNKQIFDLTEYKNSLITPQKLEHNYHDWLLISDRENSMGEYSNLIGIINYVQRNLDKKYLILITENKKHFF